MIATESITKIDGWLQMEIDGSDHRIRVMEEECFQPDSEMMQKSWSQTELEDAKVEKREEGEIDGNDPIGKCPSSVGKEVVIATNPGESKTHEEGEETCHISKTAQPVDGGFQMGVARG